jgi:magnesium transporter
MPTAKDMIMVETLRKLLRRGATGRVMNMLKKVHYADLAHMLQLLNKAEQKMTFRTLAVHDIPLAADVLSEVPPDHGIELLTDLEKETVVRIFGELSSDDAAVLIEKMPEEISEELFELMKTQDSKDVQGLLQHPKETAGRIMSPDFFALDEETTVAEAIKALHTTADIEMAFYLYVIDSRGHLLGVVSLRQLILQRPERLLRDIMSTDVISIRTDVDQEEVSRMVARYDILAVPVVDDENKLVGIVTVDDVIDIMRLEATEDMLKMAGTGEQEIQPVSLMKTLRNRVPLFLPTWMGGLIAYFLIVYFEDTLSRLIVMAGFIPLLILMGGSVGTQTSTILVRMLSTSDFYFKRFLRMIWKELGAAILVAFIYSLLLGLFIYFVGSYQIGVVGDLLLIVCCSLVLSMLCAAIIGALVPLLFHKLHIDPAVSVTPFVNTLISCAVLLIYFVFARVIMA